MANLNANTITNIDDEYQKRYKTKLLSVTPGVEGVFGGDLAIATYSTEKDEIVEDVVFVDPQGNHKIFSSTLELVLFLQKQSKPKIVYYFESKVFSGLIFMMVLGAIFVAGFYSADASKFDGKALAILGSVVGLAAGLFFAKEK